jgi:N-acetylglucosamine kinase-like BadF-type ATPase
MPARIALYAGIDAGGTTTRCVVANRHGSLQGVGTSGPGNARFVGHEAAGEAIRTALLKARGSDPDEYVAHLHLAIAGSVLPAGLADLATAWSSSNDAQAALAGALVDGPGLVVIAGTGSVCIGRDAAGHELLHGGWGPLAGDDGSAYAIGQQALRHLALVIDKRLPQDLLAAALQAHLGAKDRRALLDVCYDPPLTREAVAALAGQVAWAAERGDRTASSLLAQAGTDLADAAAALAGKLDLRGAPARVVAVGGFFASGPLVAAPFRRRLRKLLPEAAILSPRFPPAIGALILAYRRAEIQVDARVLSRLDEGTKRWGL